MSKLPHQLLLAFAERGLDLLELAVLVGYGARDACKPRSGTASRLAQSVRLNRHKEEKEEKEDRQGHVMLDPSNDAHDSHALPPRRGPENHMAFPL